MAVNLLNPACDDCYDCCSPCGDYHDPNVWYARFCGVLPQYNGYANRRAPLSTVFVYWGTNTIAADIASLLVSWQFGGSQPTVFPNHRHYASPAISIPSMDQTVEYHTGAGVDFITENPVRYIEFKNWKARIVVLDQCGKWLSKMVLSCDVYEGATQFYSPKDSYSFPFFSVGYDAINLTVKDCGQEYTNGNGGSADLKVTSSPSSEVLPSPVKPTNGNYPDVLYRTQANNAMLTC